AAVQDVMHLDIGLPADVEPVFSVSSSPFAIAPDGKSIAMVGARAGQRVLFVRRFDRAEPTEVPGSFGANSVTFSPDGASVAFVEGGGSMVRVSLSDLQQQVITSAADLESGLSWPPAGIVFNRSGALWIVPSAGGAPRALTTLDAARREVEHDHPIVLPGERL